MAGPVAASVRITNIYVQGGPNTDIQVTQGSAFKIAPGQSRVFAVSPAITAIAAVAGNSGGSPAQQVDIG
jgi:hypothetical protein